MKKGRLDIRFISFPAYAGKHSSFLYIYETEIKIKNCCENGKTFVVCINKKKEEERCYLQYNALFIT
jgi:hypothetical protein